MIRIYRPTQHETMHETMTVNAVRRVGMQEALGRGARMRNSQNFKAP